MTLFLIAAALLTATALLFLLPSLLRPEAGARRQVVREEVNLAVLRDQLRELDADLAAGTIGGVAYQGARHELERRVAEDALPAAAGASAAPGGRWLPLVVGIALPAIAAALYFKLGTPAAFDPAKVAPPEQAAHAVTNEQIANMVKGLAERLKQQPDDAEGWSMLARSYNAMGRFADAAEAYARLVKLLPSNADVLADYADTLAMASGKSLQGEPLKLVQRALEIDPGNVKALALSGSGAFERRDYSQAVMQWQQILTLVPADSDIARSTAGSIEEARSLMGEGPAATTGSAGAAAPVAVPLQAATPADANKAGKGGASAGATVSGSVSLDPALRGKVSPTDTVFIFARAAQGPRFPLAVLRKQVKDLPLQFELDDSMSMVPDAKLSAFPQVVVGARISKSGSASPAAGDLEGLTATVQPGARGLNVVINVQRQ